MTRVLEAVSIKHRGDLEEALRFRTTCRHVAYLYSLSVSCRVIPIRSAIIEVTIVVAVSSRKHTVMYRRNVGVRQ